MKYVYKTQGTCAKEIAIELDEQSNIIKKVVFNGGCSGNTQGVAKLAEGQNADFVIDKLKGIRCGMKSTSCPDQLANALNEMKELMRNS